MGTSRRVADLGLTGNISVESWNDSLPCDDGAATVIEIFRRLAAA